MASVGEKPKMSFSLDDFQKLIGILALGVGAVYLLGGLIVNLHLSRFGVTEYKLLKAKYLAVGLHFLFSSGLVLGLAAAFVVIVPVKSLQDLQIRLIISLIVLLLTATVYYNQRFHSWVKRFWTKVLRRKEQEVTFHMWWLMTFGIGLYPISLALSCNWLRTNMIDSQYFSLLILLALLYSVAGLAFITLYFGVEIYANPVPVGPEAADFIGTGKLQKVQFVGKFEDLKLIKQLGIPLETPRRTGELGLLDETEDYYLVVVYEETGDKAIKVSRELVKGIAYRGR